MFLQAGFSRRFRVVARGVIELRTRRVVASALVRWESGDYGWIGRKGGSWPHEVDIFSLLGAKPERLCGVRGDLPSSPLP